MVCGMKGGFADISLPPVLLEGQVFSGKALQPDDVFPFLSQDKSIVFKLIRNSLFSLE